MFDQLADIVRAWVLKRGLGVVVDEGAEALKAQTNYGAGSSNRIVFVPAKDPIQVIDPTHIGGEPRQLWNTMFVFEVWIAGFDSDNPDRDFAHRARCYQLWEATAQALHKGYYGAYAWASARWADERIHGRHGAELVATLALNIPLSDMESDSAKPAPLPGQPKPAA